MKKRLKKKDYENLSPENVQKVISLLNPSEEQKPITKKEACDLLNISYNTVRLQKVIEDYNEQIEYVSKRKSQNRGRAATDMEIKEAVTDYLRGSSVAEISKSLYRSAGFVKAIIDRVGVPQRPAGEEERRSYDYIPEECVSEDFKPGEIVWSAKHHTTAIIEHELSMLHQVSKAGIKEVDYESKYSSKCYAIWVVEDIDNDKEMWARVAIGGYSTYSLAYDLAKLTHLEKYGVDLSRI